VQSIILHPGPVLAALGAVCNETVKSVTVHSHAVFVLCRRLDGHIVLLNWNTSSTALLRHIASAYAVSGKLVCNTAVSGSALQHHAHSSDLDAYNIRRQLE
jgi:hypothetical protein